MHGESENGDGIDPWDASLGSMDWSPGVDYVGEWAEARGVATELRERLIRMGVPEAEVTTEARSGAGGVGAVRTTTSASVARMLLRVLEQVDSRRCAGEQPHGQIAARDPRATGDGWYGSGPSAAS